MNTNRKPYRFIISGGGTGGHIFPAVSIADEIKDRYPDAEILFVGAEGKMEMKKVPEAGYRIIGLPIAGIQRKLSLKNLLFPFKLWNSLRKAKKIVKAFKPSAAVGVGGYASAPVLRAASNMGIPCLLQEQNSYAGLTNKWLKNKVQRICVAYEGMEEYFPKNKLRITGNPVRKNILSLPEKSEGLNSFGLVADKPVILVLGGSLGARIMNESILAHLDSLKSKPIQLLWQCGKFYHAEMKERLASYNADNIVLKEFIIDMPAAYAAADIIVSRSGALAVSELENVGKPTIFVPSKNVAEDHQTKNAKALMQQNAALLVTDDEAVKNLIPEALALLENTDKQAELSENIKNMGRPTATQDIVDHLMQIIE